MTAEEEDELEVELVDLGFGQIAVLSGRDLLLFEALGGFEVDATEGAEVVLGKGLLDLLPLLVGEVGVLVELGLEALDLLEAINELGAGVVAHEVVDLIGLGFEPCDCMNSPRSAMACMKLSMTASLVDQPDLAGPVGLGAREESDGGVDAVLLLPEVENLAVGLGRVEDAVGAGEGLD